MYTFIILSVIVNLLCAREYQATTTTFKSASEFDITYLFDACKTLGTYIPARIESAAEHSAAWTACQAASGQNKCFIDIARTQYRTSNWFYVENGAYDSNNPVTYFNWDTANNQPDATQACVAMFPNNAGAWHDVYCTKLFNVLCTPGPPTVDPTLHPTETPTRTPSKTPTSDPSGTPTSYPSVSPTKLPTIGPTTAYPTVSPTEITNSPTKAPTTHPITSSPSKSPITTFPTADPTIDPTIDPTADPTVYPTSHPTVYPIADPTADPTVYPTSHPTVYPIADPTIDPTDNPTVDPTVHPIVYSTKSTRAPADSTLFYRLILEGDFEALTRYLDSNQIDDHDFALGAIETLMDGFYLSRLTIIILGVYEGSIVIEYGINSNGHDISMIYEAVATMNRSAREDDIWINGVEYPLTLNERIFNYTDFNATAEVESEDVNADGVVGLFVFLILICCVCAICGVLVAIMKCVLACLDAAKAKQEEAEEEKTRSGIRRCIYYTFWMISLPLQLIFAIATLLCVCHGCTRHVGLHFIHFMMNVFSTILLAAHFSFGDADYGAAVAEGVASILFGGWIDGETIYGLAIIGFALMNFATKMKKLHASNQEWKQTKSETAVSIRIKDLQIVIVGSSDTMFKILSGIAVIIGSKYSGTNVSRNDALKGIVDCIFAAALLGPIKETAQLLHEYLTVSLMSLPAKAGAADNNKLSEMIETKFNADNVKSGIFDFLGKKAAHAAYKAKYSEEKTILWNGVWAGLKLLLLAIQQILAFVAASMLLAVGNDIASFLAFVLICNLCIIVIAFIFCTKFERLSIGLCFKYYLCCLYDQCPTYCEEKWIRLEQQTMGDTKDGDVPLVTATNADANATANATDDASMVPKEVGSDNDSNNKGNAQDSKDTGDTNAGASVVTNEAASDNRGNAVKDTANGNGDKTPSDANSASLVTKEVSSDNDSDNKENAENSKHTVSTVGDGDKTQGVPLVNAPDANPDASVVTKEVVVSVNQNMVAQTEMTATQKDETNGNANTEI